MNGKQKKKICIFPHYHTGEYIPLYVKLYLNELRHYFDEILLVTNFRPLHNEPEVVSMGISVLKVDNEGYDLGMFYKGFLHIRSGNYRQIACLNDSNIVFGSLHQIFDWAERHNPDFWGLFDSERKPKDCSHANSYHIQSHFIVFNGPALELLPEFFSRIDFQALAREKDVRTLKSKVIDLWEIGMTQFLLSKGLTGMSYVSCSDYQKRKRKPVNLSTCCYPEIIGRGVPVIKKRVINSTESRHMFRIRANWKILIRRYGDKSWDLEKLIAEMTGIRRKHILRKFQLFFRH